MTNTRSWDLFGWRPWLTTNVFPYTVMTITLVVIVIMTIACLVSIVFGQYNSMLRSLAVLAPVLFGYFIMGHLATRNGDGRSLASILRRHQNDELMVYLCHTMIYSALYLAGFFVLVWLMAVVPTLVINMLEWLQGVPFPSDPDFNREMWSNTLSAFSIVFWAWLGFTVLCWMHLTRKYVLDA